MFSKTAGLAVVLILTGLLFPGGSPAAHASEGLAFEQVAALRSVGSVELSPDGSLVAYTLSRPRVPGEDDDGSAWTELHVIPSAGGSSRAYVSGEVGVSGIAFTPDGQYITYLTKRGDDEHTSLWAIPVSGGESRRVLGFDTAIANYEVSPDGKQLAFIAMEKESKDREKAKKKGYKQEVFEEDWLHRRAWLASIEFEEAAAPDPLAEEEEQAEPAALEIEGSAFQLTWTPDARQLAVTVAPRPAIDARYMLRRIHIVDAATGESGGVIENPGKLGAFHVSPDGNRVALISAADPNDPRDGRLMVASTKGGALQDLIPDLAGHVTSIAWKDATTIGYVAAVGVETEFGEVDAKSGKRKVRLRSGEEGSPVLTRLSVRGGRAAFVGQTAAHPGEVFVLDEGKQQARRLTDNNPWLENVALAKQEVFGWKGLDGLEMEGILIRPLSDRLGDPAPLIMIVHGGPEGHVSNGWVTSYSRPGQLAAASGYAVFYPNYRGSTGRGVAFSKLGQGDAGGKEFDDLVAAVDALAAASIADPERTGVTGGSYGGYATGWLCTRFTERFQAGVMFVGISNKISKGLTTEIPIEDKMVHTLFDPWKNWEFSLERSPIYHAEKGRTPLLIAGGTADTRVHPSQSLQLYRALKLIGKAPVRYIRYPGEGHGNRKAAARDDYTRRLMRWMDHFLLGDSDELPEWDLGLGIDPDEDEDADEDE